jgi:hypothetical protein
MMNSRCSAQVRAASDLTPAGVAILERTDQPRRADGARDVASGTTLKPYPPVLG